MFIYFLSQWCHNGCVGISNHQHLDCLLNCLLRHRSKKTSKLHITGLCEGNSPVTSEFPAQMASNEENVSIWWSHHATFRGWNPLIYTIWWGKMNYDMIVTVTYSLSNFVFWNIILTCVLISLDYSWLNGALMKFSSKHKNIDMTTVLWKSVGEFTYLYKSKCDMEWFHRIPLYQMNMAILGVNQQCHFKLWYLSLAMGS